MSPYAMKAREMRIKVLATNYTNFTNSRRGTEI
jgi:flagellar basal body rod protein FlgC